jgi:Holliday junction resolvase
VSGYSDGRRVEYAVIDQLRIDGYDTIRGASSKGLADVVGIKPGQVVLVNCKRTTMPGPAERADLLRVASHLPGVAVPLVARKPLREPLTFVRLLSSSHGHYTVEPWWPDDAAHNQGDDGDEATSDPWPAA